MLCACGCGEILISSKKPRAKTCKPQRFNVNHYKRPAGTGTCRACGNNFVRPSGSEQKTCGSKECISKLRAPTKGRSSKTVKKCKRCGVEFSVWPSQASKRHCSKKCADKSRTLMSDETISHIKGHIVLGVSHYLLSKYFDVDYQFLNSLARERYFKDIKPCKNPPELKREYKRPTIRLTGDRLKNAFKEYAKTL